MILNFRNNEDQGECWFDEYNAEHKVVQFFTKLIEGQKIGQKLKVLDLGTGNGHLLFELCRYLSEEVPVASIEYHGVDYSSDSIELARSIHEKKFPDLSFIFEEVDFISKKCPYLREKKEYFDVLFDKGTLDAIALNNSPVDGFDGKSGAQVYPTQVTQLMHPGSLLIITSCNFTEQELAKVVTQNGTNDFKVWKKIPYKSLQFGGVEGSTLCTIAFIKE